MWRGRERPRYGENVFLLCVLAYFRRGSHSGYDGLRGCFHCTCLYRANIATALYTYDNGYAVYAIKSLIWPIMYNGPSANARAPRSRISFYVATVSCQQCQKWESTFRPSGFQPTVKTPRFRMRRRANRPRRLRAHAFSRSPEFYT